MSNEAKLMNDALFEHLTSNDPLVIVSAMHALCDYLRMKHREVCRNHSKETPLAEVDGVPIYRTDFNGPVDIRETLWKRACLSE